MQRGSCRGGKAVVVLLVHRLQWCQHTCPADLSYLTCLSLESTAAPSPYSEVLAMRTASSSLVNEATASTGPNTCSSIQISTASEAHCRLQVCLRSLQLSKSGCVCCSKLDRNYAGNTMAEAQLATLGAGMSTLLQCVHSAELLVQATDAVSAQL